MDYEAECVDGGGGHRGAAGWDGGAAKRERKEKRI